MNKDILHRKIRKLIKNPKQFFADSKAVKSLPIKKPEQVTKSETTNVLGSVFLHDLDNISLKLDKPVRPLNYEFSSIIIKERKSALPKNEPIYSNIITNPKNFVGFREKNVVLLDAQEHTLKNHLDLKVLQEKPWNTSPFSEYRNIFIVDPTNNLPSLIKATSPFIKIHCIFTEKLSTEDIKRCIKWSDGIDICIVHSKHIITENNIKRIYSFSSTSQLLDAINNVILIHGSKPYDLLVPCIGYTPFLNNIDSLNESDCDVYIKLKQKTICKGEKKTFTDLTKELAKNVDYILCRESIMQRYDNIISHNDVEKFLSHVSSEGFRLEIVD